MNDCDVNDEIREALDSLKVWLASRSTSGEEKAIISAPEGLRSIGFADLALDRAGPEHNENTICSFDFTTQKSKTWTELSHLVNWSSEFYVLLKNNKMNLATLNLLRGAKEFPISMAKYQVEESLMAVSSALSFEFGHEIQHPDTKGQSYAVCNILVDDSAGPNDIIRQAFTCLYSKCAVRLIVKTNLYYSSILIAYIVDLMHQSGATASEIDCVAYDKRENSGSDRFSRCITSVKGSKLSVVAAVFKQADTFAAAQGIIESYFRESYPNLLVLVEEAAYERFIKDWQRYYSNVLHIGTRVDARSTVVDQVNSKLQIDLEAIDLKASHKMNGNAINVLKFRTLPELMSLLGNLRKVPYMSIWNDDILLTKEFCSRLNQCHEFWINHIPKRLSFRRFAEDMMNYYLEILSDEMTHIYNSVSSQFSDEIESLKKAHTVFMKKDPELRTMLILQAFTTMISKSKSLKNGTTVSGSIARLKRFQQSLTQSVNIPMPGNSTVETSLKPVGLAIILVKEENAVKSKALLMEFIVKNLLLGNGVLLVCPINTLGARFVFENGHTLPFKMVNEPLPDISKLTLDSSFDVSEVSSLKKQCPKNTYAVEMTPEMSSESLDAITVSLGSRLKSIWLPDVEQINYWANDL